ncbi:MAG: dihydrofolate reductase [Bacteroidia bacterium]|nr:dihydrofolate reductase [Bacteroidia bacterium]
MRKLVLFMHTSLDGFVAGPNGEMDWIKVDDEMFDYAGQRTEQADTALYGRVTYEMMNAYWPTAADQPNASKHDIDHSRWYNKVEKIVVSRSLKGKEISPVEVISANLKQEISNLKKKSGKEIIMFGSPSLGHALTQAGLIDDYWLFVNPILLGDGIPMFKDIKEKVNLKLVAQRIFPSGVTCLHYQKN